MINLGLVTLRVNFTTVILKRRKTKNHNIVYKPGGPGNGIAERRNENNVRVSVETRAMNQRLTWWTVGCDDGDDDEMMIMGILRH